MLSKVIALFMALLIGNPMCCCAMASLFEDDVPEQTKPNVHSCCSHSIEDSEDEDRPDKPDCCPCFLEKERVRTVRVERDQATVKNELLHDQTKDKKGFSGK